MSAASAGKIGLDLVVNENGFKNQMSGIMGLAKKAGAALGAAFATKKLIDFGKQCLELGSDLSEVQNVVDVTFPAMSKQVDKFAKNAAASFGMSETMAKKYTGTFGSMAKAFGFSEKEAYEMSTSLAGLSGDVASFYNLTQDEAYTKLKSVFTGETESLKDLGVVMTQTALDSFALANGFGKTTKEMTEAEKVALRYQFVQNQLSGASGDFIRTSDGWANQVRVLSLQFDSLKASIGQGLINVLTPVIKMLNVLIGKLVTAASAFKSFTELITGKKSDSGGVSDTAKSLEDAAEGAAATEESTEGIGTAAKKAAKELGTLGFDKITKIGSQSESDSGTSSGSAAGSSLDFGSVEAGESVLDDVDAQMQGILDKGKELAKLFQNGLNAGFGKSETSLKNIKKHLSDIGKSLKDIFGSNSTVSSAAKMVDSITYGLGQAVGALASCGVTIGENLIGGLDIYLKKSKEYLQKRIISLFDITGEIAATVGDFCQAFADAFSVFSEDAGKRITASLIGIFTDAFLGLFDLVGKLARDLVNLILQPLIENKENIKEVLRNTLEPIGEILETLHESVRESFDKINDMYDEQIKPLFDSLEEGLSEIVDSFLEGYNKYIAPVLDQLSKKFDKVWREHIQPVINNVIDIVGQVANVIQLLWESVLQPFLNWIAKNVWAVIALVLSNIGNGFLDLLADIGDVCRGITDVIGGIIDFIVGVFTGDWEKAWNGVKRIFQGIWEALAPFIKGPINQIIGSINSLINGVVKGINAVVDVLNKVSFKLPDWLPGEYAGKKFGINLSNVTAPQIPYLAKGGFVKANTPRLAVIGDNRNYGEIVAPENKMQEMVNAAVKAAAGTGGISKADLEAVVNNAVMRIIAALSQMGFYLDGELLATAVLKAISNLDYRYNPIDIL